MNSSSGISEISKKAINTKNINIGTATMIHIVLDASQKALNAQRAIAIQSANIKSCIIEILIGHIWNVMLENIHFFMCLG